MSKTIFQLEDSLYEYMPEGEVDDLVGWITHMNAPYAQDYGSTRSDREIDHTRQDQASHNLGTVPSSRTIPSSVARGDVNATEYVLKRTNELLHVPTSPPKPSHLNFLSQCAQDKCHNSSTIQTKGIETKSILIKQDFKNFDPDRTIFPSKSSCSSSESSTFILDEDSIYQHFKSWKPSKSVEESIQGRTKKAIKTSVQHQGDISQTLDESALVAFGTLLQESMTAMLLPLAHAHMKRLTALKHRMAKRKLMLKRRKHVSSCIQVYDDETSDDTCEWILPVTTATRKLIHDREKEIPTFVSVPMPYLLSSLPPTIPWDTNHTMACQLKSDKKIEVFGVKRLLHKWCKVHKLNVRFVILNNHLFRIFLGNYTFGAY